MSVAIIGVSCAIGMVGEQLMTMYGGPGGTWSSKAY